MTLVGAATLAATFATVVPLAGSAGAAGTVNLNPSSGPYTDGQSITVSGSGFSTNSADSIEIVECADPGGTSAGLPTDNSTCDANTENANTIFTNSSGTFSSPFPIAKLPGTVDTSSPITCDATHFCVLWVGEDFNQNFSGTQLQPTGFSAPFEIGTSAATPESPVAIALPTLGGALVAGGAFVAYRRRKNSAAA